MRDRDEALARWLLDVARGEGGADAGGYCQGEERRGAEG